MSTLLVPDAIAVYVNDYTLTVDLSDGRTIAVPIDWFPRLALRIVLTMALIGLWALASHEAAYACSCVPPGSPSEALENSVAVFVGEVVSVREFDRGDGTWGSMDPTTVEFEVTTVWKGSAYQTMYFTTPRSGASCGFTFVEGVDYVVYSWNGSEVSLCSRTRTLSEAAIDLDELGMGRAPDQGTIASTPEVSAYPSGGGCGIGSSVAVGPAVALVAGLVWLGMRRRSSTT